jgi:hypothetical protein
VTWSVTVPSPGVGTPTGNVTVTDGAGGSCVAPVATLQCSLVSTSAGTKTLIAAYAGDANFLQSSSPSSGSGALTHTAQFAFSGFFAPVDNVPVVNKGNAGQAIPVKWRLTDVNGNGISDPSSFVSLTVYQVSCGAWAALPADPLPTDQLSTSGLLYEGNGNWQFNWKTPKNYAGLCMVARVTLSDSTTHDFDVSFK